MCRLAAYLGPAISLGQIIVEPKHSLLEQSQHANEAKLAVNGDGFGFAWYDRQREPGLYRDVLPAWSDGNLPSLCRMIRSRLFLAHVRASTTGETSRVNCHPFAHGPWTFMHNGQVPDFGRIRRALEALLPDELFAQRRGSTDSELIFLLLLTYGLNDNPVAAVDSVLALLAQRSCYGQGREAVRLTCVLSDGTSIYAFRHASDGQCPTLYVRANADSGWTLASEPLDGQSDCWMPLAPDAMVRLDAAGQQVTPLQVAVGKPGAAVA